MARRPLSVITESFPDRPGFDTAVSRALLLRVAARDLPETMRLHRPGAVVAFGRRDVRSRAYGAAVAAARARGYEAVERLAGGRAAAWHEGTVAFAHARPESDAAVGVTARFMYMAEVLRDALRGIGVDAYIGAVRGEYCPGDHSVNARRRVKLAGIGQRLLAGGSHIGGLVVAHGSDRIRDVLVPVYRALNLEWDPATAGSVSEEVEGSGVEQVLSALIDRLSDDFDIRFARLDLETRALAERLAADHLSPAPSLAAPD